MIYIIYNLIRRLLPFFIVSISWKISSKSNIAGFRSKLLSRFRKLPKRPRDCFVNGGGISMDRRHGWKLRQPRGHSQHLHKSVDKNEFLGTSGKRLRALQQCPWVLFVDPATANGGYEEIPEPELAEYSRSRKKYRVDAAEYLSYSVWQQAAVAICRPSGGTTHWRERRQNGSGKICSFGFSNTWWKWIKNRYISLQFTMFEEQQPLLFFNMI